MAYIYNCSRCGKFTSRGTWANIYDFVAMEQSHEIIRCEKCSDAGHAAHSNARPSDGDMRPYEGKLLNGEIA